ncbi:O-antigen ligase family protein [Novosphingobium silvae]
MKDHEGAIERVGGNVIGATAAGRIDEDWSHEGGGGNAPLLALGVAIAATACFFLYKPAFYAGCISMLGVLLFVWALRAPLRRDMATRAVAMAFFMPVTAWMLPNIWLVYLVMLAWVPLFAGRLERVAGIYLFSLLLLPGLDMTFEFGGTRLFDFGVHDALAIGSALLVLRDPRRCRISGADDRRVSLLLVVLVFGLARETSFTHFMRTAINVALDYGLPYFILSRSLPVVEAMRSALRWLACAGAAIAPVLVFEVSQTWPIYNELYWRHNVPMLLIVKMRGAMLRAGGPFNEPTSMALVLAMCAFALWLLRDDFRTRARHALLFAVTFAGLSSPQSRNAWVGLGLAIALADIFVDRWSALLHKLVPTAAAITMVVFVASSSPDWSESLGLSGQGSDTAEYRRNLLQRGSEEFWKSPIIGYSSAQLESRLNDMRQGEGIIDYVNSYLWFGLVAGLPGLLVFVANLFSPLAMLWSRRWTLVEIDAYAPAAFVFGCVAMLGMTLVFTSFGLRPSLLAFGFFGFAAALRAACRTYWHEEEEKAEEHAQPVWPQLAAGLPGRPQDPLVR